MKTTNPIKVMVVDDSIIIRRLLKIGLETSPDINVVSTAENGNIAIENIDYFMPDVIVLDIEMPEMNGIETLKYLSKNHPNISVIMCSSLSESGAKITLDCLNFGAKDYITKPSSINKANVGKINQNMDFIGELIFKIIGISEKNNFQLPINQPINNQKKVISKGDRTIDILAIGSSTGGPDALLKLFKGLPSNFITPIVIVQHMPPIFTRLLAERINLQSDFQVYEAIDGQKICSKEAYVCPGDRHMIIEERGSDRYIKLIDDPPVNYIRPCVDLLFNSVSEIYGRNSLAIILTGMGFDGLEGCKKIKKSGGFIYVQDKETSVVWSMPGVVASNNLADKIVAISEMGNEINKLFFH